MQKNITKEELAAKLNGRSYRNEITPEEELLAKENHLVMIFGASDDLVELRGAINEELGTSVIRLTHKGILESDCDEGEDCPYFQRRLAAARNTGEVREIKSQWGGEGIDALAYAMLGKPTWCFDCEQLDNKFATFDIFDEYDGDREYFCRGIVIDLDQIWPSRNYTQLVMEEGGHESC